MRVYVRVKAEVLPTEDEEKVAKAISRIFPEMTPTPQRVGDRLILTCDSSELASLRYIKENFRRRRVRAVVARLLGSSATPRSLSLRLSKQAAYVGQASVLDEDESPAIGWIELVIETDDPGELIKWLTK